jgi:hypothetical protein
MKCFKIIGAVAAVVLASAAFGASGASGDVLCKGAPNASGACPTLSGDYAAGTVFTTQAPTPRLTQTGSPLGDIVCQGSVLSFKSTSTGSNVSGSSVPVEVTELNWSECKLVNSGIACTVSTTTGYTGSIVATNDVGNGKLSFSGSKTLTVVCGTVENCSFQSANWSLLLGGGNPATLRAEAQPLKISVGGFGCPDVLDVDATYTFNGTNTPVWVATKNA